MLIGMFGFYADWTPLYEFMISPWRDHLKGAPKPGFVPQEIEATQINAAWTQEDNETLSMSKDIILSSPILQRPNPDKRYYLKTDWCKAGMAAVLLQCDDSPEALAAMQREDQGSPCEFEKTEHGLRLHPIKFISRRTTLKERSYHSYVGEAGTSTWGIEKFRPCLLGREFTLLTDMNSMKQFFESQDLPSHVVQ